MRLLHVIHSVNPAGGGPMEVVKQISAAFEARGFQGKVLSLDPPLAPWVRDCPLSVHALGRRESGYGYTPMLVPWLRSQAGEFDAVLVHGIWQYSSFGVWRALRDTKSYAVFPHGMLDPWFKRAYPWKHLKKLAYWRLFEHRVLRGAKAVLFTCEEERRLAQQSFTPYCVNERVVHLGTAMPSGDPETQKACFLQRFPHLRGSRLLLFFGRLHPKKGPDLLIQAFSRILKASGTVGENDQSPLHLVVAGPCADPGYMEKLRIMAGTLGIQDQVTFTGLLSGDAKWGALRTADVFILPSHQENFGISVVEALAVGAPVLISNRVNIWREIDVDGAGLVGADTREGTEQLINRWLSLSVYEQTDMRVSANRCFLKRFEIQRTAGDLIKVLLETNRAGIAGVGAGASLVHRNQV